MKRIITVLFAALFCLCAQTYAQNRADELMKQAQESLAKKEYIKARYLFLQAYNSLCFTGEIHPGSGMWRQCQRPLSPRELL